MKIKNCFLLGIILLFFSSCCTDHLEKFYSTSFLKDHLAVRASLKEAGFQDVTFKTPDKLTLSGLFLARPHATCNVIVCAGWLPGRKEGMATFYDLLPQDCNIFFFDARGHGESEGSLIWKLWRYGIDEYKDILGAIAYMTKHNTLPIIIAGICSGAFNATHAMIYLEEKNLLPRSRVKGLIFDSGWGSILKIITTAPAAGIKKRLASIVGSIYGTKKNITLNNNAYQLFAYITDKICIAGYHACARALTAQYDHITNVSEKINRLTSPIFFIHSYDDTYANFDDAAQLAALTPNKQCWWIEKSYHAKHHLIHKKLYKEKVIAFINSAIKQKQ